MTAPVVTLTTILAFMLGAATVLVGVLVAGLADRIRYSRGALARQRALAQAEATSADDAEVENAPRPRRAPRRDRANAVVSIAPALAVPPTPKRTAPDPVQAALVDMGYNPAVAAAAARHAAATCESTALIAQRVREALQACPRPRAEARAA